MFYSFLMFQKSTVSCPRSRSQRAVVRATDPLAATRSTWSPPRRTQITRSRAAMFSRAGTKLKNWTTFLRNGECLNQCRAFIEIVF